LDSFALFYTFFIVHKCVNFCQDKTLLQTVRGAAVRGRVAARRQQAAYYSNFYLYFGAKYMLKP
jgi:hypothetical protein